jgi:hypothetical protein
MEHATIDGLDDLWATATDEPESLVGELVAAPAPAAIELHNPAERSEYDRLQELENRIFAENLVIVLDATRFREIEPDADRPPQAWVDELGEFDAQRRFRVAKAAWMGAKDAPVGISIAAKTVSNLSKARALRDSAPRTLNIEKVVYNAPQYGRLEIQAND